MDDFLRSDNSLSNLYEVCCNVTTVLQKCSFRLRKWITNNQKLLESFEPSERLLKKRLSDLDEKESNHNTLGLICNVKSDVLKLCFIEKFYKETKRGIISFLCSVFNPLGFITPHLLKPMLIIQEVWKLKINWDETLLQNLRDRFKLWMDQIANIPKIEVKRHYSIDFNKNTELHIFADSSNLAYGAVPYFQVLGFSMKIILLHHLL